jgi:hypothetical protein
MNPASALWYQVAAMCPIECEVSHIGEDDYEDAIGAFNLPVKRMKHHYEKGTLTVTVEQYGWTFHHPGLKGGKFFVHALNGDTSPSYAHVFIRRKNRLIGYFGT